MNILEIESISKRFTNHLALDNVSLSIPRGSIYGLLGPNGAGKSTLIKIINRITAPDSGKVLFSGKELSPNDIYRIGYLPEERGLYKKMKVGEQAIFFARLKGLSRLEATKELKQWFEKFEIEGWWDKRVEELSKGMAQKVQFITTVLHKPELLIFDEPFSGFDPINANLLKKEILALRDGGATVIFSTHNMSSVEEICDHITLINQSKNILSGSVDQVRRLGGVNTFDVLYRGSQESLSAAIGAGCTLLDRGNSNGIYSSVKIQIPLDEDIRPTIAAINQAVELRSFEEIVPSMNDIFIRAVSGEIQQNS
ncbi:MAG: ATP-binding cassette domain-containing protein [Rikenellaceae bacterium]